MNINDFANEMLSQLYDKVAARLTECQGRKGFVNLTEYTDRAYYYVYGGECETVSEGNIIGIRCVDGIIEIVGSITEVGDIADEDFAAFDNDDTDNDETERWTPIRNDVSIIFGQTLLSIAGVIDQIEVDDDFDDYEDLSDKLLHYNGSYNKRTLKRNGLCIVCWPESQYLCEMDKFWEHAWLINDTYGLNRFGSCAYVVEEAWYNNN